MLRAETPEKQNKNQDPVLAGLTAAGFPVSYAELLAKLQKQYPQWQFKVLDISRLKSQYTWDHVIYMETDKSPRRSLISGSSKYAFYFHPDDETIYDAGCRRASRAAVEYFMDPRNFLNERDIFQFLDLTASARIDERAVAAALRGTFMAKGKLENGSSYAEYLTEVGKKLNVNAVFLASRVRQEQGLQGTPLISGTCGSLLSKYYQENTQTEGRFTVLAPKEGFTVEDLEKLNGLYNFFNIDAAGYGRFNIYLRGMREAQRGTPEMAVDWGAPQWDKRWKALYGGAVKIAAIYIGNYQNTIYLQKWNVDPRSRTAKGYSRNFWGQYMQNIGAALSEGRNMQSSFAKLNMLELPFVFLIPIYKDIPASAAADPADGKCSYYRSHSYKKSAAK